MMGNIQQNDFSVLSCELCAALLSLVVLFSITSMFAATNKVQKSWEDEKKAYVVQIKASQGNLDSQIDLVSALTTDRG